MTYSCNVPVHKVVAYRKLNSDPFSRLRDYKCLSMVLPPYSMLNNCYQPGSHVIATPILSSEHFRRLDNGL